jgi:hypothetical protein
VYGVSFLFSCRPFIGITGTPFYFALFFFHPPFKERERRRDSSHQQQTLRRRTSHKNRKHGQKEEEETFFPFSKKNWRAPEKTKTHDGRTRFFSLYISGPLFFFSKGKKKILFSFFKRTKTQIIILETIYR